jgi:hypothetical protein
MKRTCQKSTKNFSMEHHFWRWQQLYQSHKAPIKKTCSCQGQLELGFWQKKGNEVTSLLVTLKDFLVI